MDALNSPLDSNLIISKLNDQASMLSRSFSNFIDDMSNGGIDPSEVFHIQQQACDFDALLTNGRVIIDKTGTPAHKNKYSSILHDINDFMINNSLHLTAGLENRISNLAQQLDAQNIQILTNVLGEASALVNNICSIIHKHKIQSCFTSDLDPISCLEGLNHRSKCLSDFFSIFKQKLVHGRANLSDYHKLRFIANGFEEAAINARAIMAQIGTNSHENKYSEILDNLNNFMISNGSDLIADVENRLKQAEKRLDDGNGNTFEVQFLDNQFAQASEVVSNLRSLIHKQRIQSCVNSD